MALTGRLGLLALVGAAFVGFAMPSWWGILIVNSVLLLGVVVDLALAGSVRSLRFSRQGDTAVRLGESATVTLTVENPGPRQVRGSLRDAWVPSAGAVSERHRVDVPAGERRRFSTVLRPTRRGDRPADRVTLRSVGPLGLAARQGSHRVPWVIRTLP